MSDDSSSRQQIRDFVLDLARQKGISGISDSEILSENGVIDSLAIFRVVMFLEDTFHIRIPDEEILSENFESVDSIDHFVEVKLLAKATRR